MVSKSLLADKRVDKINGSRIRVTLNAGQKGVIGYKYQHQILGLIYNFLNTSDPNYANWLHEEGYYASKDSKNFKLFCVSGIKFYCSIKAAGNGFIPAKKHEFLRFSFQIASPINQFLQHLIVGLFDRQGFIVLGNTKADIETVESLPEICLSRSKGERRPIEESPITLSLKPLNSPIFVKKPMPFGQSDKFLFPEDKEFAGYLNKNLKDKYRALFGCHYLYDDLQFDFYERLSLQGSEATGAISEKINFSPRHSGKGQKPAEEPQAASCHSESSEESRNRRKRKHQTTKVVEIPVEGAKPYKIKGTIKPFKVTGHPELIKTGLYCGFGSNNSMGCGYVEVVE